MFRLSGVIIVGVVLTLGPVTPAEANIVRNPLYDLKVELCEPVSTASKKTIPKNIYEEENKQWRVDRGHLISTLLSRYSVELPYAKLMQTPDVEEGDARENIFAKLLAETVAPCDHVIQSPIKGCLAADVYKADPVRFKDKGNALRFRRALLRLFDAAETGTSRDFVVVRRYTPSFKITTRFGDVKDIGALDYRPLVNAHADDVMIRRFILAPSVKTLRTSEAPFEIFCRGGNDDEGPAKITELSPRYILPEQGDLFEKDDQRDVQNAIAPVSAVSGVGDFLEKIKAGGSNADKKGPWTKTLKLAVVKNPTEFAKTAPEGAVFGVTEANADRNEKGDNIKADAAIGVRWQKKMSKHHSDFNEREKTLSATAFVSVDQGPITHKFFNDKNDEGVSTATFVEAEKEIAFADLSVGLRLDAEWNQGFFALTPGAKNARYTAPLLGYRKPGLSIGTTIEYVTDNYKEQKGWRIGGEIHPPQMTSRLAGYRQPQELTTRKFVGATEDRVQKPLGVSTLWTGWSLEWDVAGLVDYIEWNDGRTPLIYDTIDQTDRRDPKIYETVLFGGEFEIELLRANRFGSILGDSYLSVTANYQARVGFDDPEILVTPDGDPVETFDYIDMFKLSAKLSHKDFSNLSMGLSWETGRDYKSLNESDFISIEFGAKY